MVTGYTKNYKLYVYSTTYSGVLIALYTVNITREKNAVTGVTV